MSIVSPKRPLFTELDLYPVLEDEEESGLTASLPGVVETAVGVVEDVAEDEEEEEES
jgi:hypothetical protein